MTTMFDLDVLVIGAGVIGLAIGRSVANQGRAVTVVDRHMAFGMETSSRNSEVIHAGIYYPEGSLKARMCVAGRHSLYQYCKERHIPHRNCGKLIVASGVGAEAGLNSIKAKANACGVDDIAHLSRSEINTMEPEVACDYALFSPSTGIIDSHALMQAYIADIESADGQLVLNTYVRKINVIPSGGFRVWLKNEDAPIVVRTLINAAGLWADKVAQMIDAMPPAIIPRLQFARGVYFSLSGTKSPFQHLVYPLPDNASLGVHATLDIGGAVRFGPDVEWVGAADDYHLDPARSELFREAIQSYWPNARDAVLVPAYAGIRPKLCGPGDPPADFRIDGPATHGISGLVSLFGIESPGLTSSIAIGEHVARIVAQEG